MSANHEVVDVVTARADRHVWKVNVYTTPFVFEQVKALNAVSLVDGFKHRGHAIGYIKRMAKHSPDSSSVFHVFQEVCDGGKLSTWQVYLGSTN